MKSKRKRIRVKVSELLKKIEEKKAPRLVGIIPPYFCAGMAQLELESERRDIEQFREISDSLVSNPKVGAMIYCGTGGNPEKFNEAKELFFTGKYPYSEEEYKRIINQGFTK